MRSAVKTARASGVRLASAGLAAVLCACTPGSSHPAPFRPSLKGTRCPDDVANVVLATPQCDYLTVLEHGADKKRKIKLLVVRVDPTSQARHADPMLVISGLAVPNYGGIAPLADRTGREVILLDSRGVGHSQPNLDCPEVDALGPQFASSGTSDPTVRNIYTTAVRSCHDRLTPVADLSAYTSAIAAHDISALAQALKLKAWNGISYGAGPTAIELLASPPAGLRSMILDTPEMPTVDPRALAGPRTRNALGATLDACAREPSCQQRFPFHAKDVDRIVARYQVDPVTRIVVADGKPVSVRYDGVLVVRLLRYMLSAGPSAGPEFSPAGIPALLHALEARQFTSLDERVTEQIATDPAFCVGYLPKCERNNHVSLGAYLSQLCTAHPLTTVTPTNARLEDAWGAAFTRGPYSDICAQWPVTRAVTKASTSVNAGIPVLVTLGGFDPFTSPETVRQTLGGLPRVRFVVVPWGTGNILGSERCAIDLRNRWLDDPGATDACPASRHNFFVSRLT